MERFTKIIFGLAVMAIGLLWILNLTGVLDFNIFFRGWWTIFILLPCLLGFISRPNWGSVIGFSIGVLLLLQAQRLIDWSLFWQLGLAVLIIVAGAAVVFSGMPVNLKTEVKEIPGGRGKSYSVAFGEKDERICNEVFEGAEIEAAFSSATLDLREAIIRGDVRIGVNAKFAGVRIFVPEDVAVEVRSSSAFGGVNNRVSGRTGTHTIFIDAECAFAGVEIR